MPRGGRRQGVPGKGYSNRTDLLTVRAPATGADTPASAGVQVPQGTPQPVSNPQAGVPTLGHVTPDMVPRLDDPTLRPDVPVTNGLLAGPGAGPEALGPAPYSREAAGLMAAFQANPTPELRRALLNARARGAL